MEKKIKLLELIENLGLKEENLKDFYQYLFVDEKLTNYAEAELSCDIIDKLVLIDNYIKLGFSHEDIVEKLNLSNNLTALDNLCPLVKNLAESRSTIILCRDNKGKTTSLHNSLSKDLDLFLESREQFDVSEILTFFNISTEDMDIFYAKEKSLCSGQGKQEFTFDGILNGRVSYLKVSMFNLITVHGKTYKTITIHDETEDFFVSDNTVQSKLGLRMALDEVPYPLIIINDSKIVYANKNILNKFKKPLVNHTILEFMLTYASDYKDREFFIRKIRELSLGHSEESFVIEEFPINIDLGVHIFKLSITKMEDRSILIGFTDITERREHQQNLMNERNLFRNGPVMILKCSYIGGKKKVDWISDNVHHFTGYTKEEFLRENLDINDLIANDNKEQLFKEANKYLEEHKEHYTHEPYKIIKKDNTEIWVKDHTNLTFNQNDKCIGFFEYLIDVSEMKEFENKLKISKEKAEAASLAKSTFLSHMSHEIRTPLNAINGFAQLIYDVETDMDKRDKLRTIVSSGEHLLNIINNILELSRVELGNERITDKEFSFKNMLDEVTRLIQVSASQKDLKLETYKNDIIPENVIGDELKIKQVLINVLSNAVNYTERGKITLTISHRNNLAIFEVKDTGVGIPKDRVNKIFDAFEQIKHHDKKITSGTGLGLAIVKNIIDSMNGFVEVKSELNVGTTFTIKLPLKKSTKNIQLKAKDDKIDYDLSHLKVLVAEDNKINQKLIRSILKKVNIKCDLADNGQIALDKLEEGHYDILLLDMQMPVMDGMTTIKNIRKNPEYKDFPVIALTAFAMHEERDKYLTMGCNEFVAKPIKKLELYEKMDALCSPK